MPRLKNISDYSFGLFEQEQLLAKVVYKPLLHESDFFLEDLYVFKAFRGWGLGKRLVKESLLQMEAKSVTLHSDNPLEGFLNHIFSQGHACEVYLQSRFSMDIYKEAPWLHKLRLPKKYQLYSLENLPKNRYQELFEKQNRTPAIQTTYPIYSSDSVIEKRCSVVIIEGETIVAWSIGHLVAKGHVHYSSVFVEEMYRNGVLSTVGAFSLMKQYALRQELPVLSTTQSYPLSAQTKSVYFYFGSFLEKAEVSKKKWLLW